jgi:ParB family transcriptional regulator, chromosome partitioning protein
MAQQYGLGRGLASLIPPKKKIIDEENASPFQTVASPETHSPSAVSAQVFLSVPITNGNNGVQEIPIEKLTPNPHQPRFHFDPVKLEELAQSIKEHGILQPLIVSPLLQGSSEARPNGERYELIAGERRFQAAKSIGLRTVPVIVRDVTEQEKLELSIIENIQRHDLNPIEEAKAYLRLLDEFGMQQEAVAKKMGKSRSTVANTLRLLHLPIEIQRAVAEGKISEGHAKSLLAIENPEKQRAIFDLIIKEELTVRETEMKVRSIAVRSHTRHAAALNPEIIKRAEQLTQILGTKVKISPVGKGGKIIIEYYATEDLDGLLRRLEE